MAAALHERIGQIDENTAAKHTLGPDWLDEIEARHAHATRGVTRLLTALRTALEGLEEIAGREQGTTTSWRG